MAAAAHVLASDPQPLGIVSSGEAQQLTSAADLVGLAGMTRICHDHTERPADGSKIVSAISLH